MLASGPDVVGDGFTGEPGEVESFVAWRRINGEFSQERHTDRVLTLVSAVGRSIGRGIGRREPLVRIDRLWVERKVQAGCEGVVGVALEGLSDRLAALDAATHVAPDLAVR